MGRDGTTAWPRGLCSASPGVDPCDAPVLGRVRHFLTTGAVPPETCFPAAVVCFAGQQSIERVFRGLKDGEWLAWGPMYHWTDRKIRIHAFYCMLGISLLHYLHKQAQAGWADLSLEQLLAELGEIKQFVLLYPPQAEKGPARTAYVLSQQTLAQQALVKTFGLAQLHRSTPRGTTQRL